MNHSRIVTLGTGVLFFVLGLLLFATLVDLLSSGTIYGWAIPILLLVSGVSIFKESVKPKAGLSYVLIATGLVMLLVQLNVIRGDVVNAVLGTILVSAGSIILARTYRSQAPDKKA